MKLHEIDLYEMWQLLSPYNDNGSNSYHIVDVT